MNRFLVVIAVGLLSFGVAGCLVVEDDPAGPPDRVITCGHFDEFLASCWPGCAVTWDCELNYDSLPLIDQFALDDCSDCLVANLDTGYCDDCVSPDVGSCQDFMADFLGVSCW